MAYGVKPYLGNCHPTLKCPGVRQGILVYRAEGRDRLLANTAVVDAGFFNRGFVENIAAIKNVANVMLF